MTNRQHSLIETVQQLDESLAAGAYTSVGCYPIEYITADGGVLCPKCVKDERETIADAINENDTRSGWRVVACDVNYEGDYCCDHCGDCGLAGPGCCC